MTAFIQGLAHTPPLATYLFVLVWLALESCGVPLPNELVLLLAGSLDAQRHDPLGLVALALTATAGSLIGATAAYTIGSRGGRPAILRYGRYVRLDERRLDSVERWFARSGAFAIVIARITPFVRTVASFPAGILRMPPRVFYTATLLGSLVWCIALVGVGYALGTQYMVALSLIERYTVPAIIVLVALVAGYLWLHRRLAHVGEGDVSTMAPQSVPAVAPSASQTANQARRNSAAPTAKRRGRRATTEANRSGGRGRR